MHGTASSTRDDEYRRTELVKTDTMAMRRPAPTSNCECALQRSWARADDEAQQYRTQFASTPWWVTECACWNVQQPIQWLEVRERAPIAEAIRINDRHRSCWFASVGVWCIVWNTQETAGWLEVPYILSTNWKRSDYLKMPTWGRLMKILWIIGAPKV